MLPAFFQISRFRSLLGKTGRCGDAAPPVTAARAVTAGSPASGAISPPPSPPADDSLEAYLFDMGNFPEDIRKCRGILALPRLLVEIGCGTADLAREIALHDPDLGVMATDIFDCQGPCPAGSRYRRVAMAWREKRLDAQQACPENLVVLRAEVGVLGCIAPGTIDAVLLINPEPAVGTAVLAQLAIPAIYRTLKPGPNRIVVLPFSREMGVSACGGLEFDHSPDWSRGLGFLKSSSFSFHRGPRRHWGVDLTASRYTPNSTQSDVYVHDVAPGR